MSVSIADGLDPDNDRHIGMLTASTYHHLDQVIGVVPWGTEHTYSSELSLSPDARFNDLYGNTPVPRMSLANAGSYYDTSEVSALGLGLSTANHQFPQVPPSAAYSMPFGSAHYLSGDTLGSPDNSMVPVLNHSADRTNKLHCGSHAIHRHFTDLRPVNPADKTSFSLPSLTEPTQAGSSLESEDNESEFPMLEGVEEQKLVVTRHNHNIVEKQYRNRLNHEFDRLLAVLQTGTRKRREEQGKGAREGERAGGGGGDNYDGDDDYSFNCPDMLRHGGRGGRAKGTSKAEVLRTATKRIKLLEQETRRLRLQHKELLQTMEAAGIGSSAGTKMYTNPPK